MGTRAMVYIHDGNRDDPVFCAIYRQMDGYPSCMGENIKECLGDRVLVNGMSSDRSKIVNGLPCAAAFLIGHLKDGPGSIYMEFPNAGEEDYNYHIFFDGDQYRPGVGAKISVSVEGMGSRKIWSGFISDLDGEKIEASELEDG